MASLLSPVTDSVVTLITGSVLPAVLTILGGFLTLIVGVYGALLVYSHFTGGNSSQVFYKLGRMFGAEIYDNDYRDYRSKRDKRSRIDSFDRRYRSERK